MGNIDKIKVLKGAFAGIVGGLVGSLVMTQFQSLVTKVSEQMHAGKNNNGKKDNSESSTVKAANAISEGVFGHHLTKDEKGPAGEAVHYAMGAASGFIYGVAAEMAPVTTAAAGVPFGAAVWVFADDVAVPALGLSKPATEFPLSTHAYALSSHLVYGVTTDLVRRAVLRAM